MRVELSRWPLGLLGTLAIVVAVESFIGRHPLQFTETATLSWTLADRAARRQAKSAEILCLGDSLVKHGLLPEVLEARLNKRVYNLSVCGAMAPATYYLLKHALDSGARPSAIVVDFMPDLLTGSPKHAARNFPEMLDLAEIADLARASREFSFFATAALDRLVPSIGSRWEIRKNVVAAVTGVADPLRATNLTHGRNWGLHRGAQFTPDNPMFNGDASENDHYRLMSDRFWCNRVNRDYIHKFLSLARSKSIPVYWLIPPVTPMIQARRVASGVDERHGRFVRGIVAMHSGVVVLDARKSGYDHTKFVDPVHLTGKGALSLSAEVADAIAIATTAWVDLPPYRDRPSAAPLEDVEQSRLAVIAALSATRR